MAKKPASAAFGGGVHHWYVTRFRPPEAKYVTRFRPPEAKYVISSCPPQLMTQSQTLSAPSTVTLTSL